MLFVDGSVTKAVKSFLRSTLTAAGSQAYVFFLVCYLLCISVLVVVCGNEQDLAKAFVSS